VSVPDPAAVDWVPIWPTGGVVPPANPSTRVYRATAQSIPNTTWTPIQFSTVRYDNGGQWAAGQPTRLTCQVAGTYAVWGAVQFVPSTGGATRAAAIWKNGNYIATGGIQGITIPATGGYPMANTPTLVQLAVGDYIEIAAYQDSGAALNTNVSDAGTSQHACELAMALVGGMQGPAGPGTPSYGTSLPASPADGQEAILVDSLTNPSYQWRFRYNAGSSSAYKWEYIGGNPWFATAYVGTWQQFSGSSNWVVANPGLAVPRAGDYWINWSAQFNSNQTNTLMQMGAGVGGAAVGVQQAMTPTQVANSNMSAMFHQKITGIGAGQALQPAVWANQSISQLANMVCQIYPARVS
jgi:hypothetical protein